MRELIFSLDKEGLYTVFSEYEILSLQTLWESPELSSLQVYSKVNEILEAKGMRISRASVINFLNEMVDRCFLDYREETGKGGYKRIYRFPPKLRTEKWFRKDLADTIIRHVLASLVGE